MSTAGARREDEGLRIRIGRGDRSTRRRKRRGTPATRSRMMESDRASINSQLTKNEHNSDERVRKGVRRAACGREGGKTLTFLSVVVGPDCRWNAKRPGIVESVLSPLSRILSPSRTRAGTFFPDCRIYRSPPRIADLDRHFVRICLMITIMLWCIEA